MSARRLSASVALAAAVAVAAAGCSTPRPAEVKGTATAQSSTATPHASASTGTNGAPARITLPSMLTAKDLPTWKETALPRSLATDWVRGCGRNADVVKGQRSSRSTQLAGPRGLTFQTRVATYSSAAAASDALASAQALITGCAIETDDNDGQTVMSLLAGPAGQRAVGALIETSTSEGAVTGSVGYWLAQRGATTIEVRTSGSFLATGATSGMEEVSSNILAAALAKADGRRVPTIPIPQRASTNESPQGPDIPAESDTPGSPGNDAGSGDTVQAPPGGVGVDGSDWTPPAQPEGVGGESGPGTVSGPDPGAPLP